MTRFAEIRAAGAAKSNADVAAELLSLSRDPRFAAVVACIDRSRASWVDEVSSTTIASDHGKLARAGGAIFGLKLLLGQLQRVVDQKADQDIGREPDDG